MSNIKFFYEWLSLDKNDFRILALLAAKGDFKGNFSDLCAALSLSRSGKNNKSLDASITRLRDQNYITAEINDNQIQMAIIPKAEEIYISEERFAQIFGKKFKAGVAWQVVLKVYLWLVYSSTNDLIHRADIAETVNVSPSSITSATNVLQDELHYFHKKTEKNFSDGKYITLGQYIVEGIDFTEGTFSSL